jgi:indolepyruvate ferredoxin oxidoreductase beta subunit
MASLLEKGRRSDYKYPADKPDARDYGTAEYPENILEKIKAAGEKVIAVDALDLAVKAGSVKATNVVLLGVAARELGFGTDIWLDIIKKTVPPKTIELNKEAFITGYNAISQ